MEKGSLNLTFFEQKLFKKGLLALNKTCKGLSSHTRIPVPGVLEASDHVACYGRVVMWSADAPSAPPLPPFIDALPSALRPLPLYRRTPPPRHPSLSTGRVAVTVGGPYVQGGRVGGSDMDPSKSKSPFVPLEDDDVNQWDYLDLGLNNWGEWPMN